jgi:para-nitrobenzyl esterase
MVRVSGRGKSLLAAMVSCVSLSVSAMAGGGLLSSASAADGSPALVPAIVQIEGGPVRATPRGGMVSYFAIPFAAPPVGDLRWRPPGPAPAWSAPIARSESAASCLQTGRSPFRSRAESEDCLYLDVHAPAGPAPSGAPPYPVMVWIHGGAFTTGAASVYADPSPLVSKGVIVVVIAYRLGAMGFLAHPALRDADGASGDYGIMDQQAALRWVRANIAAFGGDARNVTIFGESAGGFSVLTHLASPLSAGLFDKAIIESGTYGVAGQMTRTGAEARGEAAVDKALAAAGAEAGAACAGGKATAACLRGIPEAVVRARLMGSFGEAVPNVLPTVDGKVLPRTVREIFDAGADTKVPVINGSNRDENRLFVGIGELVARFSAKPPSLDPADRRFLPTAAQYEKGAKDMAAETGVPAAELTGRYYPLSAYGPDAALAPGLAVAAAGTDSAFSCNAALVSDRIVAQGAPVWGYEFRDESAPPVVGTIMGRYVLSLPMGAAHASELSFLFHFGDLPGAEAKALSQTMATYWTNFARSGDPNGPGAPAWPGFKGGAIQALDVAGDGGVTSMPARAFLDDHKCRTAWTALRF